MYNPCIRGWISYYSHFYKMQLRSTLKWIEPMSSSGRAKVQATTPPDQMRKKVV
jgi:hypothetical protein